MFPFLSLKSATQKMFHRMRSRFFLCLVLLVVPTAMRAQWETMETLEKDWSIYQTSWKTFLPYVSSKHYAYKSKSLLINPKEKPKAFLTIEADKTYFLFLNGAFQRQLEIGKVLRINLDSLQNSAPGKNLFVYTFYAQDMAGIPQKVSLQRLSVGESQTKADFLTFRNRNAQVFYNFFSFSFLSLLAFLGLLFAFFPKYFFAYFRLSDWIHWELKDDAIIKSPLAFPNLMIIFILSLLTAYISFFIGMTHQSSDAFFDGPELNQSLGSIALFIASKTGIAFVLFSLRYVMYRLFCSLFKLDSLAEAHFYKSIQTNFQFFTLLFLGLGLYAVSVGPLVKPDLNQISWLVNGYFFLRAVYYFQLFRTAFRFNQISLFAYLILMEGQVLLYGVRELIFPEYI
mgnify:FL=1